MATQVKNPWEKTHSKATETSRKNEKNNEKLLRVKTGILDQQICPEPEIPAFDQTRRRPHRDRRGPIFFF